MTITNKSQSANVASSLGIDCVILERGENYKSEQNLLGVD